MTAVSKSENSKKAFEIGQRNIRAEKIVCNQPRENIREE